MWKKDRLWISKDRASGSSLGYLSFKKKFTIFSLTFGVQRNMWKKDKL
jgi:hypothetical protein